MSSLKISIVTPSYQQGRYIRMCINGVKNQSDVTVDHIILDNCSTDETGQALEAYRADPGSVELTFIVEPDNGQTDAINRGFKMATGDVVCWLNTDEWYAEGALARVAEYFHTHPKVDVVFGDCDFVDSEGNLVKRKREYGFSQSMLIYYGCFMPSCATFIRRRVIDTGLWLDPEFRVTMDFDWYVRIAKAGYRIAHIPYTLASFTWHDNNISSAFLTRRAIERRMVQDRYSGIRGPYWWRSLCYEVMRCSWISLRILRRRLG